MFVPCYRIDVTELPKRYRAAEHRLLRVDRHSPMQLRKEVEKFATYFRDEFRYDFMQYDSEEEKPYTAYLFASELNRWPRAWVGAACFKPTNFKDVAIPPQGLNWIWIHPFWRNRGILREWWPTFRESHGDYWVEPPVSPAMKQFLLKHNKDSVFYPMYQGKKLSITPIRAKFSPP